MSCTVRKRLYKYFMCSEVSWGGNSVWHWGKEVTMNVIGVDGGSGSGGKVSMREDIKSHNEGKMCCRVGGLGETGKGRGMSRGDSRLFKVTNTIQRETINSQNKQPAFHTLTSPNLRAWRVDYIVSNSSIGLQFVQKI